MDHENHGAIRRIRSRSVVTEEHSTATAPLLYKTFSATKRSDREVLGEKATAWLRENPNLHVVWKDLVQSSDAAYHCVTLVLVCRANGMEQTKGDENDRG